MKKIAKVLLTLGVLMLPAGLWAKPVTGICSWDNPNKPGEEVVVSVPQHVAEVLHNLGWVCVPPCPPNCDV